MQSKKICKIKRGKMKDNTKFSREFLKGPRKKCEDCGFSISIPKNIIKLRTLKCSKCGAIYRALVHNNKYIFIKFHKNNK